MLSQSILQRAFELARSGQCADNSDLRRQLKDEGFENVEKHFNSQSLARQLNTLIKASRELQCDDVQKRFKGKLTKAKEKGKGPA